MNPHDMGADIALEREKEELEAENDELKQVIE